MARISWVYNLTSFTETKLQAVKLTLSGPSKKATIELKSNPAAMSGDKVIRLSGN